DAQDFWGPFRMYDAMIKNNPKNQTYFIMGPWLHGGYGRMDGDTLGNINFGSKTGGYYREKVELPFFNYYLKDKGKLDLPKGQAFEAETTAGRSRDGWPPAGSRPVRLYFDEKSTLSFDQPRTSDAFDSYVSDPEKPVPYSAEIRTIEGHLFMVEDQ